MTADYVIVGAGAAGCVLADRLSASGASVVLLEAGTRDRNINIKTPAAFSKLFKSKHDWNYETVAQPELANRRMYWPRGKVLGGSTSMNAMIYIRGHRATFDAWAEAGNDGWAYPELLGSFVALEDQERGRSDYHGTGGGLSVGDLRSPNPLSLAFIDAAVATGYGRNDDFNDDTQEGFGQYQVTQRDGVRCSAATAFLKPAMKRPNLRVITGAHATRVVIKRGRAAGVEWVGKDGSHITHATTEVILSGGAINSPQLLMLSGIGPESHLRSHGIDVVQDAPNVGENLIDHLAIAPQYEVNEPITLAQAESFKPIVQYLTKKTGMLSSNVGEAGGFVTIGDGPMPDLQFIFAPAYFIAHGFGSPATDGMAIGTIAVDPKSRGKISLASGDPMAAPLIDPRYLSDESDLWLMVEGCKLAREFAEQPSLAAYIDHEHLPGASATTDDDLASFVREYAETLYHPVGTCAMGPDENDVVDAQLRVRGVDGLRVADASVMPSIVNGNTQAIAMVIGSRAADFIEAG